MKSEELSYRVTKKQLMESQMRGPEEKLTKYLRNWALDKIDDDTYKKHKHLWDRYGAMLGHDLVVNNELFPTTIPIGYVICSFFKSVILDSVQRSYIIAKFNKWIQSDHGNVRRKLFESYENKETFTYPSLSEEQTDYDDPIVSKTSDILYKQPKLFSNT